MDTQLLMSELKDLRKENSKLKKYEQVMKWLKDKRGIVYFQESSLKEFRVTIIVDDCFGEDESFWVALEKLKIKLKENTGRNRNIKKAYI